MLCSYTARIAACPYPPPDVPPRRLRDTCSLPPPTLLILSNHRFSQPPQQVSQLVNPFSVPTPALQPFETWAAILLPGTSPTAPTIWACADFGSHREHDAKEVYVTGSFDDWKKTVQLQNEGGIFKKTVTLPAGKHHYKVRPLFISPIPQISVASVAAARIPLLRLTTATVRRRRQLGRQRVRSQGSRRLGHLQQCPNRRRDQGGARQYPLLRRSRIYHGCPRRCCAQGGGGRR